MIYTTGTVSTVSGSAIVSGTGTKWTVNNPAIRSGTIILIKNGNANFIYMVDRVNSDTELVISQPATFTVKNTSYSINLTEPNSYSDANNRMTAIASDTTYFLRAMDQWMMNNGVVTVELSNGQKVTLDSIKKMQGDISSKFDLKKGGTQKGVGELQLNSAIGVSSDDMRQRVWLSLFSGFPQIKSVIDGVAYNYNLPKSSGTMMLVGDYGIGGKAPYVSDDIVKDTLRGTGFFSQGANAGSNYFGGYGSGFSIQYDNNIAIKLFINGNGQVTSECLNSGYQRRSVLWGTGNTTTDPQGFIKKASPIIDINPDGTFTTNDESEGATVTRVAQGEYLIEGVLGFNSDAGWGGVDGGIEIPLDVNKQPLIWVDSEVMEDGSILVRTYHRTHPNAPKFARNDIDGYKDGDPIDIPDGRFISVRVQMPEQSIYNVRMREMEEAQKAEEERRQKEEEENQDTNKTPEIDN
ncbi:phage tail fiber protein [Proteus mirabilis]|uniref:phage tail fiber protein n=1 Tax=Proteus mirabilis TaxID=584 RepID=UPI003919B1CD